VFVLMEPGNQAGRVHSRASLLNHRPACLAELPPNRPSTAVSGGMSMLSPEHKEQPCLSIPDLERLEALIESSLTHDWILRVEYTDEVTPGTTSWQQWGEALFAIREAAPVMESIAACRTARPRCHIRLQAEKLMPRTRMLYCVYRVPQVLPQTDVPQVIAAAAPAGPGALFSHAFQTMRQRVWRTVTLAGMLIASLLLIEGTMA
jgi:ribulose bisphosphate carboxylase small subunit